MHFISALTLIYCVFHASATVLARRRSEHHSRLLDPAERSDETDYYRNFAGAVLETFETGDTFYEASGTFTAPQLLDSPDGGFSVRVGIDLLDSQINGNEECNGTLSAGVDITPSQNGADGSSNQTHRYTAWYHGGPDDLYTPFPNFTLSAGDDIRLSVDVSSAISGSATVENLTTAQTASLEIYPTSYLCQMDVGWIVQVMEDIPIAQFGELIFYGATATGIGNHIYTPADATEDDIFDIIEVVIDNRDPPYPSLRTITTTQGTYLIVRNKD